MATLSSPTRESLLKEVRILLNQQKAANSNWSDEELTIYLNDGVNLYFQEIADRVEGQFDTSSTLNLVSGQETVALPSNFHHVRALYKVQSTENVPLRYNNNLTQPYDTQTSGTNANTYEPYYYFRGNSIVLRPAPQFSETGGLLLEYTQFPDYMITGQDVMASGISPIFKELIVMYAVHKAKIKEDLVHGSNTAAAAANHLSAVYQQFQKSLGQRSQYPTFIVPFNP